MQENYKAPGHLQNSKGNTSTFAQNFITRQLPLHEKCPYSEFIWSAFSCIRTEYGEILRISFLRSVLD